MVWNKNNFGHIQTRIKENEYQIGALMVQVHLGSSVEDLISCKAELFELQRDEEAIWRQRARISWIKEGDRNTRFFHCLANMQRWRNMIHEIHMDDGIVLSQNSNIGASLFLILQIYSLVLLIVIYHLL